MTPWTLEKNRIFLARGAIRERFFRLFGQNRMCPKSANFDPPPQNRVFWVFLGFFGFFWFFYGFLSANHIAPFDQNMDGSTMDHGYPIKSNGINKIQWIPHKKIGFRCQMIKGTYISGSMDGLDIKTKFKREHICFMEKHKKRPKNIKKSTKRGIYMSFKGFLMENKDKNPNILSGIYSWQEASDHDHL